MCLFSQTRAIYTNTRTATRRVHMAQLASTLLEQYPSTWLRSGCPCQARLTDSVKNATRSEAITRGRMLQEFPILQETLVLVLVLVLHQAPSAHYTTLPLQEDEVMKSLSLLSTEPDKTCFSDYNLPQHTLNIPPVRLIPNPQSRRPNQATYPLLSLQPIPFPTTIASQRKKHAQPPEKPPNP